MQQKKPGAKIIRGDLSKKFAELWLGGMVLYLDTGTKVRALTITSIRWSDGGVRICVCDDTVIPKILDVGAIDPDTMEFNGDHGTSGRFLSGKGLENFQDLIQKMSATEGLEMEIEFYSLSREGMRKATLIVKQFNEAMSKHSWFSIRVDIPEDSDTDRGASVKPDEMWFCLT